MLRIIQSYASQNGYVFLRQWSKQLLYCHHLVSDLGIAWSIVDIIAADNLSSQLGCRSSVPEVEIWAGHDGLAT